MAGKPPVNSLPKMENWSYRIREIWSLHKREIKRYGLCAWLVIVGVLHPYYVLAWTGVIAAAVMWAFDRWGRPWAERGKQIMNGTRAARDQNR